jgi:pimeloyl-ACP methyl ester carboxylesterase
VILHGSELGQGPNVVLLHGLFGRSQNLGSVSRRLAAGFRVISLDLRNHGESPRADGMTYRAMADDVLETLAARHALPAAFLGHSMGGKVAMAAALTRAEAVTRLVVGDIAPVAYHHRNAAITEAMHGLALAPGLTRAQADAALAGTVPDPAVRGFLLQNLVLGNAPYWRIGLAEIASGLKEIEDFPPSSAFSPYVAPSLFLRGDRSAYVGEEALAPIRDLFPNARVETIDDAGHWLHVDQPEIFAARVQAFLRES